MPWGSPDLHRAPSGARWTRSPEEVRCRVSRCSTRRCCWVSTISSGRSTGSTRRPQTAIRPTTSSRPARTPAHHPCGRRLHDGRSQRSGRGQSARRARQPDDDKERVYLHRGIAARQFQRSFVLAEGIEVAGAGLDNGLLNIDLVRRVMSRGADGRDPQHGQADAPDGRAGRAERSRLTIRGRKRPGEEQAQDGATR